MFLTAIIRMFILVAHDSLLRSSQSGNRKSTAYSVIHSHNSPYETHVGKVAQTHISGAVI